MSFASQAMRDLYGNTLDGLIRNGGIRLSYSKNPLGVRTPTSGGTSTSFQQQQQQLSQNNQLPPLGAGHPFFETFHQRLGDMDTIRAPRRDTTSSGVTSPTSSSSSYHYTISPQPPRFISNSPPTSGQFGLSSFSSIAANSAAFPRANPQGFGFFSPHLPSTNSGLSSLMSSSASSSFSPFGSIVSPAPALHSHAPSASTTIPDQPSADSTSNIPASNIATATT